MHSTSIGVDIFFSLMRSYFCLLVAAFSPCHGSEPRLKYMRTYPNDSRSSRLDCSVETTSGNKDDEEETGFTTEQSSSGGIRRSRSAWRMTNRLVTDPKMSVD